MLRKSALTPTFTKMQLTQSYMKASKGFQMPPNGLTLRCYNAYFLYIVKIWGNAFKHKSINSMLDTIVVNSLRLEGLYKII